MPDWFSLASEVGAGVALMYLIYVIDQSDKRRGDAQKELLLELLKKIQNANGDTK